MTASISFVYGSIIQNGALDIKTKHVGTISFGGSLQNYKESGQWFPAIPLRFFSAHRTVTPLISAAVRWNQVSGIRQTSVVRRCFCGCVQTMLSISPLFFHRDNPNHSVHRQDVLHRRLRPRSLLRNNACEEQGNLAGHYGYGGSFHSDTAFVQYIPIGLSRHAVSRSFLLNHNTLGWNRILDTEWTQRYCPHIKISDSFLYISEVYVILIMVLYHGGLREHGIGHDWGSLGPFPFCMLMTVYRAISRHARRSVICHLDVAITVHP